MRCWMRRVRRRRCGSSSCGRSRSERLNFRRSGRGAEGTRRVGDDRQAGDAGGSVELVFFPMGLDWSATTWLAWCGLVLASYLLGAVPFGLLVGFAKGVDVRQH